MIMARPTYNELLEENRELRARLAELEAENARLQQELTALGAVVAKLKGGKDRLPSFVKLRHRQEEAQRPGGKQGHQGSTRPVPSEVDEERELKLSSCPDCGSQLGPPTELRQRYVEDLLPPRLQVIRYRIARYHCPQCHKLVERKPQDVLADHHLSLSIMTKRWKSYWISFLMRAILQ